MRNLDDLRPLAWFVLASLIFAALVFVINSGGH